MTTLATHNELAFSPASIEATRLIQAETKRQAALAEYDERAAALLLAAKPSDNEGTDE